MSDTNSTSLKVRLMDVWHSGKMSCSAEEMLTTIEVLEKYVQLELKEKKKQVRKPRGEKSNAASATPSGVGSSNP